MERELCLYRPPGYIIASNTYLTIMSSYRNNYNNSNNSNESSYINNKSSYVPSSRRPDGSYREEIRVRPGHVPEAERKIYAPPAARSSNYYGYSSVMTADQSSRDSLEDRVDSWADEEAPVLSEYSECESKGVGEPVKNEEPKIEIAANVQTTKAAEITADNEATVVTEASTAEEEVEAESSGSQALREPRKPSQLAAAIDTAIDSLSIVSSGSESGASRQIGRFAAQIANEERYGGSNYAPRRYESNGYNREYKSGYTSNNCWNRGSSCNNNYNNQTKDTVEEAASGSSVVNASGNIGSVTTGNSSGDIRVEKEFKSFLERLNSLRREMAIINAKLEYIRYFKGLDVTELNDAERARVSKEKDLVARMDAIFEAIEALASNQ